MNELNATTLKNELWKSLNSLQAGTLDSDKGNAIASQAREILRTIRTQVIILDKANKDITKELIEFAS